jgi:hypothetical protein
MIIKRRKGNIPLWVGVGIALVLSYLTYKQNSEVVKANFEQRIQTLDLGYSHYPGFLNILSNLPEIIVSKFKGFSGRPPIERIDIDIPLMEYKKILSDREKGLKTGFYLGSHPQYAKAKIRYNGQVIKAKVRLKGDMADHWNSQYRMSLRVALKGGETILGFRKFSLHKPSSRQHPFDQAFSEIVRASGNLAAVHNYIQVFVNGMDWGVMDIEEHISKEMLEKQHKKESFVIRLGNQDRGDIYKPIDKSLRYIPYRLSDSRLYLKLYDDDRYLSSPLQRKRLAYIADALVKKNHAYLFDSESYGRALAISFIWNDAHPLADFNSRHYFNPYTLQLEPIITDAIFPIPIVKSGLYPRRKFDPYINTRLYRQVVSTPEYKDSTQKIFHDAASGAKKAQAAISHFQSYFPLDEKTDISQVITSNIQVVKNHLESYMLPDLDSRDADTSDSPVQAFHRADGRIEVFNGVPEPVKLVSIIVDDSNVGNVGAVIPPYDIAYARAPFVFGTELKGDFTGRLKIRARYHGTDYVSKVAPTVGVLDYVSPKIPRYSFEHEKPNDMQARHLGPHVFARHFIDGRIDIYNLLDDDVVLEELRLDGKPYSKEDLLIPAYVGNTYKAVSLKTSLKGIFDGRLELKTRYKDYERVQPVDFTIDEDFYNPLLSGEDRNKPAFLKRLDDGQWVIPKGRWQIESPLVVEGDLTIKEGAEIHFAKDSYLIVKGGLDAVGTEQQPIVLAPKDGYWKGIYVMQAKHASHLKHVEIENTVALEDGLLALTGGVTFYRSDVDIENSHFNGSQAEDALNIVKSKFNINHVKVNDVRSDGIDFDFSNGTVANSEFYDVQGDALDFSGSIVNVVDLYIQNVRDKALSVGEATTLDLKNITARDVGVGLASKDGSHVVGEGLKIEDFHLSGIMTYMKKSFYDTPSVDLTGVEVPRLGNFVSRQENTVMNINGQEVVEESLNVDKLYNSEIMAK